MQAIITEESRQMYKESNVCGTSCDVHIESIIIYSSRKLDEHIVRALRCLKQAITCLNWLYDFGDI